jgi:hypothetical protein
MTITTLTKSALLGLGIAAAAIGSATAQWTPIQPQINTDLSQQLGRTVPDALGNGNPLQGLVDARTCDSNGQLMCGLGYACTDVGQRGADVVYTCEPVGGASPASTQSCSVGYAAPSGNGGYRCIIVQ